MFIALITLLLSVNKDWSGCHGWNVVTRELRVSEFGAPNTPQLIDFPCQTHRRARMCCEVFHIYFWSL